MYSSPVFHSRSDIGTVWNPAFASNRPFKSGARKEKRPTSNSHGAPKTSYRNRVLMLGLVRELALYRAEVLRSKGFQVEISLSEEHARDLVRNGNYDVVVVSYTLPDDVVRELADEMRESCPECPVIAISNTRVPDRAIRPDRIVLADEGPKALIAALRQVLRPQ